MSEPHPEQQPIAFAPGIPRHRPTPLRRRVNRVGGHAFRPTPSILMPVNMPVEARSSFTWCIGMTLKNRLDYLDDLKEQAFQYNNNTYLTQNVKDAQEERLRITETWFNQERRCIVAFRYLVARWLYNRYKNRKLNEEDPATLAPPVKPMQLYDSKQRGTYNFELTTIRRRCEIALTFAEWMFPTPKQPSNPLTNLPFTDAQLLAILQACRNAGFGSWLLESFRRTCWDLEGFKSLFLTPLKIRALEDLCRNNTDGEFQDMMSDFVEDHHAYHRIVFASHLKIIKWAIVYEPDTKYMADWTSCFRRMHHIRIVHASDMNQSVLDAIDTIYEETLALFRDFQTIAAIGQRRLQTLPRRRVVQRADGGIENAAVAVLQSVVQQIPAAMVIVQNNTVYTDPLVESEAVSLSIVRDLIEELVNANPPQE
jgi:hypothetical protein